MSKLYSSNFNYAGPLTEIVLAGNVAVRSEKKLIWNGRQMRAENAPEVAQFVGRAYRRGWDMLKLRDTQQADAMAKPSKSGFGIQETLLNHNQLHEGVDLCARWVIIRITPIIPGRTRKRLQA